MGLMIDLSQMTGVRVDPVAGTARAQGGTKWGAFDHETQGFGLATTGGTDVDTGIAGLTLGGGIGWLSGSYGLSCDNLISADVVMADGRSLTASADENSDLLWALRGGGGNFGVVTSLEYQLHPVGPAVLAGWLIYPADKVKEFFPLVNDFTDNMPDEMNLITFLHTLPDGGGKACSILLCYHGAVENGERVIRPLRQLGTPILDDVRPMPYTEAQKLAVAPAGRQNYLKSHFVSEVSDDIVDIALAYFERITSPLSSILFQYLGNAARRVPAGHTAFGHRHALTEWATNAVFLDPGESEVHHPLGQGIRLRPAALLIGGLRQPDRHGGRRGSGRDTGGFREQFPAAGGPEAEVRPGKPVQPQPEHPAAQGNRILRRRKRTGKL